MKGHEKIFKKIIAENFPKNGGGNSYTSPRNPESPKQDETKVKHPKTHSNQINKDQTLKATREKQQRTRKGTPIRVAADLSTETLQARREWQDILK